MKIDKVKNFFALGFGIERMLFKYQGRFMVYAVKVFFGCYVWNFKIHTTAYKRYEQHLNNRNQTKN